MSCYLRRCYQSRHEWLSASLCSDARHDPTVVARNFRPPELLLPTGRIWTSTATRFGESWNSACMKCWLKYRRTEAATSWSLEWSAAELCQQRVECSRGGATLRTSATGSWTNEENYQLKTETTVFLCVLCKGTSTALKEKDVISVFARFA